MLILHEILIEVKMAYKTRTKTLATRYFFGNRFSIRIGVNFTSNFDYFILNRKKKGF